MATPAHFFTLAPGGRLTGLALAGLLLVACAAPPLAHAPMDLDRPEVKFNTGRFTVVLVDEFGMAIPGYRVDVSWEEPSFYKTSAFTNRAGEVSFSGVPERAEVSINYPGGLYNSTVLVPQRGRPEMRVMLDTLGENEMRSAREKSLPPTRFTPQ